MIAKLVAWDKQLEEAQAFMENQTRSCTDKVQSDFTEQIEVEVVYQRTMRHAQAQLKKLEDADDMDVDDGSAGGMMGRAKGILGM